MTTQHRLLSRLYQDLAELHENPYPGVVVFTDDANLRKFCLVLIPPSGPWKDLALHFDVELPQEWPSSPPAVASSVSDIDHPNLFGSYICCDLLRPQSSYPKRGYTGGYSPALTLRGLFLQFLTFFSSTKVEQDYGGAIEIGDHTLTNYIKESDMVKRSAMPWKGCCRNQHLCSCGGLKNDQLALERLWKANNTPETKVAEYSTPEAVVHTTKGSSAHPERLHKFEQANPLWSSTLSQISRWQCKKCPYGSVDFPHLQRGLEKGSKDNSCLLALSRPPASCRLGMLNDDTLTEIASQLPSESLISFGKAYPRFRGIVASLHILLSRELRCFFLRIPLRDCILGVGVAFDEGPRVLSSDFDWLSMEAFQRHDVRMSIEKRDFQYFLPLAFNRAHFERARGSIWSHLSILDADVREAEARVQAKYNRNSKSRTPQPRRQPHESVGVIYKMMNNIVVSLMKSCDDVLIASRPRSSQSQPTLLHASEKAIISYCHLFHLLICLCRTNPLILRDATARLGRFIHNPASRIKTQVPDLGELIVLVMLVLILPSVDKGAPISWTILNGPFLEEAIIRNVRWVLKDAPELEVLEQGPSEYRLATTFSKSKTSLRLMMFQITFLDLFIKTYAAGISLLDENYGFAEPGLPESMVNEIKEIYKVETWPAFFNRVQYVRGLQFTKEKFSDMLRQALRTSSERGYHTPSRPRDLQTLQVTRNELERAWSSAQTQRR